MLTDNEILARTRRLMENSIGAVGSDTRWDTTRMLDQYHGRKYGTEVEGRSQIVTREVLEQIEWAMPSLLRVFGSGDRVVMFTPQNEDDVEQAEIETDYVNHVFLKDSNGWDVLNQWMRSALLERNAYVKVYWDTARKTRVSHYEGLTEMQMAMVLQGAEASVPTGYRFEAVEVLEQESSIAVDDLSGQEYEAYDLKVREVCTRGYACVEYVPREEIRISKDVRELCLDNVVMVAHVRMMTKSELIEMGYPRDLIDSLPTDRTTDLATNTVQYARQNERSTQRTEYQAADEAGEMVQVNEAYVRLDVDEDGIAELRRVIYAGEFILDNEEIESQPFVPLCPIPQPATHVGLGLGDLVEDIQLIKTHLMRSVLDNLALTNNPEKEVVWQNIEFPDDLEVSVVGGSKRVTAPGSINPLAVPFTAGASVPIMELLDQMKETRTGISRNTMGLDADTLAQSTVGAFSMGLEQANQRLEMIARTFAETGITWLFVKLRELVMRYQDMPRMMRLSGKFHEVDPRDWSERYDVTAQVGLGTGRTGQTLGYLQAIAAKQEEHMQQGSPLVDYSKLYESYERLVEAAGFKDVTAFWNRPDSEAFQRRQQEQAQAAQAQQQAQQEAMQAQMQVAMADIQSKNQQAMAKLSEDFQKFLEDNRRKWAELELQYSVDVPGKGIDAETMQ